MKCKVVHNGLLCFTVALMIGCERRSELVLNIEADIEAARKYVTSEKQYGGYFDCRGIQYKINKLNSPSLRKKYQQLFMDAVLSARSETTNSMGTSCNFLNFESVIDDLWHIRYVEQHDYESALEIKLKGLNRMKELMAEAGCPWQKDNARIYAFGDGMVHAGDRYRTDREAYLHRLQMAIDFGLAKIEDGIYRNYNRLHHDGSWQHVTNDFSNLAGYRLRSKEDVRQDLERHRERLHWRWLKESRREDDVKVGIDWL